MHRAPMHTDSPPSPWSERPPFIWEERTALSANSFAMHGPGVQRTLVRMRNSSDNIHLNHRCLWVPCIFDLCHFSVVFAKECYFGHFGPCLGKMFPSRQTLLCLPVEWASCFLPYIIRIWFPAMPFMYSCNLINAYSLKNPASKRTWVNLWAAVSLKKKNTKHNPMHSSLLHKLLAILKKSHVYNPV